jgi:hypothetical protein
LAEDEEKAAKRIIGEILQKEESLTLIVIRSVLSLGIY